jgi:energy-coupling factor transport system substrate-specific component
VSWQGTVFSLLAFVIVAGVVWYERSRPSSRMVALVAALAALAVAGRLVLAPIPNVVATTDIVLITGYALGGAPGFAVGALAAPVSNFWLGQGPWTPWQMAGWGLVGLAGAGLAAVSGRRVGRLGLASACALAGLAYGALLDLSVMVTYGGEQSLDRYLALSVRGIPFNLAHAIGNFAFALAGGPALIRMIARYRTRLEFTWRPAGAPLAGVVLAAVLALGSLSLVDARAAGPGSARIYLEHAQRADGGYGFAPDSRSSAQMTGWSMLGLEAAGRNPLDVGGSGPTPVDYLRGRADHLKHSTGDLELAILALEGAGVDSHHFAGNDLPAQLRSLQKPDGSFGDQVNLTAYGILALRAAGGSNGVGPAASWLRGAQRGDGGWGSNSSGHSEPDSTGSAIQGLRAAGGGGGIGQGVSYLKQTQKREGGWGLFETGATNSQSTAFAVMGLVAAGVDPGSVRRAGHSGPAYLAARQAGDGHYAYARGADLTPVWVTAQSLLALEREALPIEPVGRSPHAAPAPKPDIAPTAPTPGGSAGSGGDQGKAAVHQGHRQSTGDKSHHAKRAANDEPAQHGERAKPRVAPPHLARVSGRPTANTMAADSSDDGSSPTLWLIGALAAAALAVAAFLWRRRRA